MKSSGNPMLLIGLTGGIGSGKSTVSHLFTALGAPVIDADLAAREIVEPGMPALREITVRFGSGILRSDGSLDRGLLRKQVFSNREARLNLEAILHPHIRTRMAEQLAELAAPYAILAIPLLLESGQTDNVDRILVVDCPEQLQIERACQRDGMKSVQAEAIMVAQCLRPERLAAADEIIDNSGSQEELADQVRDLHEKYLYLSSQPRSGV